MKKILEFFYLKTILTFHKNTKLSGVFTKSITSEVKKFAKDFETSLDILSLATMLYLNLLMGW